jgi:hypothetical protein
VAQGEQPDPFCWDGTADVAPAAAAVIVAPRRSRALRLALAAALAAGAAAAVVVVRGGGGSPAAQGSVLATVADVTTHVPGYRFSVQIDASDAGQSVSLSASGEFNTQPLRGSMSFDVAGKQIDEVFVPPYVYVQVPSLGANWERVAIGSAPSASDIDIGHTLAFLRTVGTVDTVGQQTLDGVQTTHYHAVIDLSRLAAVLPVPAGSTAASGVGPLSQALGGSGLPLDVWVDAQERVRELTMSTPAGAGSSSLQFSMTMKLFDYGPQPAVAAPAGAVQDGTSAAPVLAG